MRFRAFVAAACLLAASFGAFAADTMRCENAIVRQGMIAGEVLAKCGEPGSKRVDEVPVRARNRNGGGTVVGTTKIETWIYDRGAGQFRAALTFEEGKLKSIEYLGTR
jgi:hypothetical protein